MVNSIKLIKFSLFTKGNLFSNLAQNQVFTKSYLIQNIQYKFCFKKPYNLAVRRYKLNWFNRTVYSMNVTFKMVKSTIDIHQNVWNSHTIFSLRWNNLFPSLDFWFSIVLCSLFSLSVFPCSFITLKKKI